MTLLLMRHGETALNAARVLQPENTPLSAVGQRQAERLARRIASLAPAALVASDLPRAWQTALAIGGASGLPVLSQPLLRERNFGSLRGLPYDALRLDPLAMNEAPPDGESAFDFFERVALAFDELLRLRVEVGGALAVVTHGLVIQALVERHAAPDGFSGKFQGVANASLTMIEASPPHAVTLLGCTRHLHADAQGATGGLHGG
jgi:broad specificity phosphatase PhoE